MVSSTDDEAYRQLVQQLMLHGWYRLGQGPRDARGQWTWGFREGHLLDASRENTVWIGAVDEPSAMRALVGELGDDVAARSKRRRTVPRGTPRDDRRRDQPHTNRAAGSARTTLDASDDQLITASR